MMFSINDARGNVINLMRTDPRHLAGSVDRQMNNKVAAQQGNAVTQTGAASAAPSVGFADVLLQALNGVNQSQLDSMALSRKMITEPDSVAAHDVTIAIAEANLSLNMTKSIVDGILEAYNGIINIR